MNAPSARDRGLGSDVVRADPKPKKGAHWKQSIRAARLYASEWARAWTKTRYPHCVTCGGAPEEWAHVLSGKGDAVKWDTFNMTRQCTRCNQLHEDHPEHLHGWFIAQYGYPAFAALVARGNRSVKLSFAKIMKIGDELRERVIGQTEKGK